MKLYGQTFRTWPFISGITSSLKPLQGLKNKQLCCARAGLCGRPRANGSRSVNRAADWYQVEESVAFQGDSVVRYPLRPSFVEQKRRRLSDQPS